jgi:hypothetical protein
MSWKNENAIKRVFECFKRLKELKGKVWDNDIEALKHLNTELENAQNKYVNDNILYAKLLAHVLNEKIHETGNIKTSIAIVNSILKEPIEVKIKTIEINLNLQDKYNYFSTLGFDLHLISETDTDKITLNQKEMIKKLETNWSFENVNKSFYNTANDFLKDLTNYK